MPRRFSRHVRRNAVAYLALFVALGGTSAWAASAGITGAQIKDESVTGADVLNDSLTGDDILESTLAEVPTAATARSAAVSGYEIVRKSDVTSLPLGGTSDVAVCPAGKKAVGGGFVGQPNLQTLASFPFQGGVGWDVSVLNSTNSSSLFDVYAVCVNAA